MRICADAGLRATGGSARSCAQQRLSQPRKYVHLAVMADLHAQGRYDRMTDDLVELTAETPTSMHDFVKLPKAEFTRA
jgi:hypothetical protein